VCEVNLFRLKEYSNYTKFIEQVSQLAAAVGQMQPKKVAISRQTTSGGSFNTSRWTTTTILLTYRPL
jgi:hypothetical protein